MEKILKIFLNDGRKISTNVVAIVIIMGLSVIPSLYAWFNIFSNWDPYGPDATSNIKVAVYSDDQGYTFAGKTLNVGDSVVDGLKANTTIGWVFTEDLASTVKGIEAGDYYAALYIPETFTSDMISFLKGDIENPTIVYYENGKKNAIAPKITQKAQKAVKEQVNSSFVSAVATALSKATSSLTNVESQLDPDKSVSDNMVALRADVVAYSTMLTSFKGITTSLEGILVTTQLMLPNMETMLNSSKDTLNSMQSLINNSVSSINATSDLITSSLDMMETGIRLVTASIDSTLGSADDACQTVLNGMNTVNTMIPYAKDIFNNAVAPIEPNANQATKDQINAIRAQFDQIQADADRVGQTSAIAYVNTSNLIKDVQTQLNHCADEVHELRTTYQKDVQPLLQASGNSANIAVTTAIAAVSGVDVDFYDIDMLLTAYIDILDQANTSLDESIEIADDLLEYIDSLTGSIIDIEGNEDLDKAVELLGANSESLGEFAANPVDLNKVRYYPIDNYGSAMAPFYTVLGLWVGALILVAILHCPVHPIEGLDFAPRHAYFGRYILFFLVGQIQTLITVLGNMHFIGIQCANPFLFWFAASMCSFTFTIFIYSLTVAMGNIGEGAAVIIMVIQVAGAGCTFPVETLPKVFQVIYKYLPFHFGMSALKECVGGLYGIDYWVYIGKLFIYVLISLVIGLALAIPFRKLNHIIEESKEKSGVLL